MRNRKLLYISGGLLIFALFCAVYIGFETGYGVGFNDGQIETIIGMTYLYN
jgi:hypothetical protein